MIELSNEQQLRRIANSIDELEPILNSVVTNDTTMIDALAQLLNLLHQMQLKNEQSQKKVAEELHSLTTVITELSDKVRFKQPLVVDGDAEAKDNPEIALLAYLYSFLSDTQAIDVGANVGHVSESLLKAGYTVYAFEPYKPAFEKLKNISGRFHPFEMAIGASDAKMELNIAVDKSGKNKWDTTLFNSLVKHPMLADCQFEEKMPVCVRSLASLAKEGKIPSTAGVLKIDTEGYDLDVIKGMGDGNYSVVMAEYWDAEHPFGQAGNGSLRELVNAMKSRGYEWYVVIYHVDEASTISYYCNRDDSVAKSWGNVLFFKEHKLFAKALSWLEDVLKPTLFR